MSEWQLQTLDSAGIEFIDGDRGKNYPSQDDFLDIGHCLFLSTKNVRANSFDFGDCQFISAGKDELLRKGKLNRGDIVLTTRGTVGNTALYDETVQFDHVRINSGMVIIRMKPTNVDSSFFLYFLRQLDYSSFVSGSAQPQLPIRDLKQIEIALPPLPEQKAIASVLSSLDDKIDLLHRQNKTLEAMAETLFRQWFIEEEKEDWDECELSEFGNIICGKTPSKSNANYFGNDVPFLKIPDMHGRVFISKTTDSLSQLGALSQSKKMVPQNSICVSCIATVGLVCITDCDLQTNQQINSIVPNEHRFLYYLYEVMVDMYDELHNLASGGTATLNLNTGDFSRIKIAKPDDLTLLQFNNTVTPLFTKIRSNGRQIQTLENLRDTLLPKLMSGEVRVQYQTEEVA
ncbi:restriction endonuclease subunit S [Acinetobacter schindleri]|uniref:restriction endonuclease subunit S n=1 Tax=Acinetobacter schindleri TaxID=108981 RepID=UPI0032151BA5